MAGFFFSVPTLRHQLQRGHAHEKNVCWQPAFRCHRGLRPVEMEGHEARAAIAGLDGKTLGDRSLRVNFEDPRGARGRGRR